MENTMHHKGRRALLGAIAAGALCAGVAATPLHAAAAATTSDTTKASVTFTAGELNLVSAPTLDFDSHEVSGDTENYEAVSVGDAIRVSDLRGSADGYKVTAALQNFQLGGSGDQTLLGSYITIGKLTVSGVNGTTGTAPGMASSPVVLDSDGTVTDVLEADEGAGSGIFDAELSATDTVLTVYPGATIGSHVAVLNWALEVAP